MDIEKKEIKRQSLDIDTMIFSLDLERERLDIEGILTTEYVAIGDQNKIERPHIILRNAECQQTLMYLLPDDDKIIWTNPRKEFKNKLAEVLAGYIV